MGDDTVGRVLIYSHFPPGAGPGGGQRYVDLVADAVNRHTAWRADAISHASFDGDFDRYDVVHVPCELVEYVRPPRGAGRPVVATFHASPAALARHGRETGRGGVFRLGQALVHRRWHRQARRTIRMADAVVCVSECTHRDVVRMAPDAAEKIRLVENGVEVDRWRPTGRNDGHALFVGRLVRSKGIDLAVDVLSRLGLPFRVVGAGPLEDELRRRAGPNVTLLGPLDDEAVAEEYARAALCVFPSLMEGYGLVALESLASGTPAAVSTAFCIRGPAQSLLEWVPPRDAAALEAAVRRLQGVKTPAWSRRAARVIRDHHSTRRMAEGLAKVYAAVKERAATRPRSGRTV